MKSDYILYVSIHAAQAGCDLSRSDSSKYQYVSIHAAQAGCDKLEWIVLQSYISFNSRSPSGLRQGQMYHAKFLIVVSIHAAQAGCDQITAIQPRNPSCFNSRSPSGLRHGLLQPHRVGGRFNSRSPSGLRLTDNSVFSKGEFQFTQPKRAATTERDSLQAKVTVSIHAAQAGCDKVTLLPYHQDFMFQFTQPKRAAT